MWKGKGGLCEETVRNGTHHPSHAFGSFVPTAWTKCKKSEGRGETEELVKWAVFWPLASSVSTVRLSVSPLTSFHSAREQSERDEWG